MAALQILTALWSQMRFIRLCVLICCRDESLVEWLRGEHGSLRAAALLASLMGMAFPCAPTLAACVLTTLALGWVCLPYEVDNSGTYGLLSDLNLAAGLAWAWLNASSAEDGWQASAPAARAIFVTTYAYAAFAKLNSDWARVRKSGCTVFTLLVAHAFVPAGLSRHALKAIRDRGALLVLRGVLVALTLVELANPVLLCCAPLRTAATIVWVFHLAMATIAYDYSVIAVCSMVLCAPPAEVTSLAWVTTAPARLIAVSAALVELWRLASRRACELGSAEHVVAYLWLCALCPALWLSAEATTPPSIFARSDQIPLPLLVSGWALLAATIVNGAGPYLGCKTCGTWAMFSNLHTEGGHTNHCLVPAWLQPFGLARDLVTVIATDAPRLAQYHTYSAFDTVLEGETGPVAEFARRTGCAMVSHANSVLGGGGSVATVLPYRLPRWQLRRVIAAEVMPSTRDFFVEYEAAEGRRRFALQGGKPTPGSDLALTVAPPLLWRKLVCFKSVLVEERLCGVCHGP
tara:strand:+ start:13 stop:1569 length:1557 start_codon:yes stop_codon:yes gene_type:complete